MSTISSWRRPAYPRMIPFTFKPLWIADLTTARIAAFIPGASPPLVNTPIVLTSFAITLPSCCNEIYIGIPSLSCGPYLCPTPKPPAPDRGKQPCCPCRWRWRWHLFQNPYMNILPHFPPLFNPFFYQSDIFFTKLFCQSPQQLLIRLHVPVGGQDLLRLFLFQVDDHAGGTLLLPQKV